MMTENEHLLLCLAEECDEVGQRVMKALRFGLDEVRAGQRQCNADRILDELHDLISVARILEAKGILGRVIPPAEVTSRKLAKIELYMDISRREGSLKETGA